MGDLIGVCEGINVQIPTNLRYVYDLEPIKVRILGKCREEWKDAAERTSKLSTYCQIKDFAEPALMVKCNLKRNDGSLILRLLCGILPLEVETGRYWKNKKKERKDRHCKVCASMEVEDEIHHVFKCKSLKDTRKEFLEPLLLTNSNNKNMSDVEKFQWLLGKDQIREFATALGHIYNDRQNILYIKNG